MGTHPIFESDFDCLTECSVTNTILQRPRGPLKVAFTKSDMPWRPSNRAPPLSVLNRKLTQSSLLSSALKMNSLLTRKNAFVSHHIVECLWPASLLMAVA